MQSYLKKAVLIFAACEAVVLLVLMRLFILHRITPVQMAIVVWSTAIIGVVVLIIVFKKARQKLGTPDLSTDADARKRLQRAASAMRKQAIGLTAALVYVLYLTRGYALPRRLTALAIGVVFVGIFWKGARDTQKKLDDSLKESARRQDSASGPN